MIISSSGSIWPDRSQVYYTSRGISEVWKNNQKQRQEEDEGGKLWHILSQLTCKIFETRTNANSADLLAPKTPKGFSSDLTFSMVGCPEQAEYTVWFLNGTMCESQTRELWSEGSGPSRLHTVPVCWGWASAASGSLKLTTTTTVQCSTRQGSAHTALQTTGLCKGSN